MSRTARALGALMVIAPIATSAADEARAPRFAASGSLTVQTGVRATTRFDAGLVQSPASTCAVADAIFADGFEAP